MARRGLDWNPCHFDYLSMLNCLAAAIPGSERVVSCEEVFELAYGYTHYSLTGRPGHREQLHRLVRRLGEHLAGVGRPGRARCGEAGQVLGVSRQRIHQLRGRDDFPVPVVVLGTGPLWTRVSRLSPSGG